MPKNVCSKRSVTATIVTCPRISSSCAARASTTSRTSRSTLPRDRLIVITGLSGSGKSSLAFDTIYAEGQRRYVESPVGVRPPVPGPDGEAGRRPDRRPQPGHLHRPEGQQPQPAVDGRHGDRDLRLPAPAVRPRRPSPLPDLRPRGRSPERQPDRGAHPGPARRHAAAGPGSARQGPQDGGRPGLRGGPPAGLRARPGGPRAARPRRRADAGQVQAPHHRGGRRPARGAPRRRRRVAPTTATIPTPTAPAWPTPSRRRSAWGRGSWSSRRPTPSAFEELRYSEHYTCPYDGTQIEDLEPRSFSFNSPHGACPTCTGLGIRLEIDPAAGRARPLAVDRRRGP